MNKNMMIDFVANNIKSYLPEEYKDASVEVNLVHKLNESYTALAVRKTDACAAPCINLDAILKDVTNMDQLEATMDAIAELVQRDVPAFEVEDILDYEKAKDKLMIKLVNADCNKEVLKHMPHKIIEDLAVTYHIIVDMREDGNASACISENILESWGIDIETLHRDAVISSVRNLPGEICSLAEKMRSMGMDMGPDMESPLVVVTNTSGVNGAAVLLYPGVMEQIANRFSGSYYILPSSIHECLVIPEASTDLSVNELLFMVTDINETQVAPDERLADAVYYYDALNKTFKKVSK